MNNIYYRSRTQLRKMSPAATIVSLDGVPGAGKSRLLKAVEKYLKSQCDREIICLQEPVEEWNKLVDESGATLFSKYYGNQKRYSLAFQLQILHTRFEQFEKAIIDCPGALILTERDIETDYRIFTQMLYDNGMFEELEFLLYKQLYNSYYRRLQKLCKDSAYRVCLTTSPSKCLERIRKRGRKEEASVSLEYLQTLYERHMNVFGTQENTLMVEGDTDCDEVPVELCAKIAEFVHSVKDSQKE